MTKPVFSMQESAAAAMQDGDCPFPSAAKIFPA
jgi:hypothetical protein